ncbi:MAG TPA: hypothetical protein PKH02_06285 [Bacteroidales bacterium]|nr:hypothetical protein [Bacteroidales bacterium]
MEENKMKKHVTAVATLQIAFGAIDIMIALGILFFFGVAKHYADDQTVSLILNLISIPISIGLAVEGILNIVGAIGLFSFKNWGRIMTLIMGGFGLIWIPFGTLKGVYVVWVLVQSETITLFEEKKPDILQ